VGKKGGSKVKESATEKALAQVSQQKWNRYKSLYRDVERDFIEDVSQDTSPLLRGRAIADVAQASGDAAGDAIALGRGSVSRLGTTARTIGGARALGAVGANKQAQALRDKGQLSALGIGLDMSVDAQNGLATAARASNQEAIAKARAQQIENEALVGGLGTLAGATMASYDEKTGFFTPKDYSKNGLVVTGLGSNYVRDVKRG
jgi:hypothetical protein